MTTKPLPDLDPKHGYLMSMTLENVRCFGSPAEELSLASPKDPSKPARWTVILGANGVGKTTVLRALAAFEYAADPANITPRLASQNLSMNLGRADKYEGKLTVQLSNQKQYLFEPMSTQLNLSGPSRDMRGDDRVTYSARLAGFGAGRAWRGNGNGGCGPLDTLFDRDAQVRDPNDTLFRFDYREKSEKLDRPSRFEAFKTALTSGILPDVTDLKMGFAANDRPIIQFKTQDGWIALDDMSWGYQVFAAFAADYASRLIEWYPDSKTPLAQPGICLVDELDLHMHPKWQREVIDHLSSVFPATQFIVTVHSPLVVQAAEDANLVVLKRYPEDPTRVQIDNDVEAIKGWRIDQVLTSDLFGLDSSRPPSVADGMAERRTLLGKSALTGAETERLRILNEGALNLPTPGSDFEIAALKLVSEATQKLKKLG